MLAMQRLQALILSLGDNDFPDKCRLSLLLLAKGEMTVIFVEGSTFM